MNNTAVSVCSQCFNLIRKGTKCSTSRCEGQLDVARKHQTIGAKRADAAERRSCVFGAQRWNSGEPHRPGTSKSIRNRAGMQGDKTQALELPTVGVVPFLTWSRYSKTAARYAAELNSCLTITPKSAVRYARSAIATTHEKLFDVTIAPMSRIRKISRGEVTINDAE